MTKTGSKMLVAVVTMATLALGATTVNADRYARPYGRSYVRHAPAYYPPRCYAPAPVVYAPPSYSYCRPMPYVQPVYYAAPRYYAPAPVYQSYYAPSSFGIGFGYGSGSNGRYYGGGFGYSSGDYGKSYGGGFSYRSRR